MITNLCKLSIDLEGSILPIFTEVEFSKGTGLCNPSIILTDKGKTYVNLRHVQYTLYHCDFDQKHYSTWGCLAYLNPENDISLRTTNYLGEVDLDNPDFSTLRKVDMSKFDIEPVWEFIGLEDCRIVEWDNRLYLSGVRRDTKPDGEGRMELTEVQFKDNVYTEVSRSRIEPPFSGSYCEKNWMPIVDKDYHYLKWSNPVEVVQAVPKTLSSNQVFLSSKTYKLPRDLRGGSQVIPFEDGYIAITHEVDLFYQKGEHKDAQYYHRFIFLDKEFNLIKVSEEFKFMDGRIEFCCGMIYKDSNFYITFGYQDNSAYMLKMPSKILSNLTYINLEE